MAKNNKRKERPEETIPGNAQVPDIRRDDAELLKRGRTEKGGTQNINTGNRETPTQDIVGRDEGPVNDNVTH